jgi:hypothetical protein
LGGADEDSRPPPAQRVKFVLPDLGSPFASKPNVVAYDRHVLFAPDDPTGVARHRASGLENTPWVDVVLVHELAEQLVGSVFAQAGVAQKIAFAQKLQNLHKNYKRLLELL